MNFMSSSPEHIEKVTSDNTALGYDLLSNLTYMSVLTIGGLSRDKIMELSSAQALRTSVFFDYVVGLVKTAGFEYGEAFKIVASKARASVISSLFLRFSAALSSGESEKDFIIQEADIAMERYKNDYERSVENLRKWTDAYSAILVSVTLVMVVCLISTIIASMNELFIVLMALSISSVTSIGLYIIFKVAPIETKNYRGKQDMPKDEEYAKRFFVIIASTGFALALITGFVSNLFLGWSVAFGSLGLALLPMGIVAMREDKKIRDLDSQLHTFLRSLGNIAGATGSNLTQTLKDIDTRAMGFLGAHITRLRLRLEANLSSELSWERFRQETSSELVNRTTHMLVDGAERGGSADDVGNICANYALGVSQLREKRQMVASTFAFLAIPMHATMVFILIFVMEILTKFNAKLSGISEAGLVNLNDSTAVPTGLDMPPGLAITSGGDLTAGLGMFSAQNLALTSWVIVSVIVMLTIANGLAPKFAAGGSNRKIAFTMSLTCLVSGVVMVVVPALTSRLFSI